MKKRYIFGHKFKRWAASVEKSVRKSRYDKHLPQREARPAKPKEQEIKLIYNGFF